MSNLERFAEVFKLPEPMLPFVSYVVNEQELELILAIGEETRTLEEVSTALDLTNDETEALLTRAYNRDIINKEGENGATTYSAGTFYRRMDHMARYENWGDVPAETRDAVLDWQLAEFMKLWMPAVEEIKKDPDTNAKIPNRDVLLLEEALEMVDAATEHAVVPCDCRSLTMACKRPLETCIRLNEGATMTLAKGLGRKLTKDECKELVTKANKRGLIATGRKAWREMGLFGFCNCCACDCYPIRASQGLRMDREWPRTHYVAVPDWDVCTHCGACVKRCHFGAFHLDGTTTEVNGKQKPTVAFDPEKCWGCGLCRDTCVWGALHMDPVEIAEAPLAVAA